MLKRVLIFIIIFFVSVNPVYALELVISGNGSSSDNTVNLEVKKEETVSQTNEANVENNLTENANTGGNTVTNASADTKIDTGNISENINIENNINQSFATSNDCCDQQNSLTIENNLSDTNNSINVTSVSKTNTTITQTANITNTLNSNLSTGKNVVGNVLGSVQIDTGNVKVSGSIVNGPVNTVSHEAVNVNVDTSLNIIISNNAQDSTNQVSFNSASDNSFSLNSFANIDNDVYYTIDTGNNKVNNVLGDVAIFTGNVDFDFLIKNSPVNTQIGSYVFSCCGLDDPGDPDDSGDPNDPPDPSDPGTPGIGGSSGSSTNSGGGVLADSSSNDSAAMVLGLSNTSGRSVITFLISILFLSLGSYYLIQTYYGLEPQKAVRKYNRKRR